MWIDFVSFGIFALFVIFGVLTGGISQLLRLGAAGIAFYVSPMVADYIRPLLGGMFVEMGDLVLQAGALIIAAASVYVVLVVLLWMTVERALKRSMVLSAFDRMVGAALGGIKALVLLFVVGHALLIMSSSLPPEIVEESVVLDAVAAVRMDRFLNVGQLGGELLDWFELRNRS